MPNSFIENVNKVASLIPAEVVDLSLVANSIENINKLVVLSTELQSIVSNVVPNITEILQSDDNAIIATTQASIATTKADEANTLATIATTQAGVSTAQAGISTIKASEALASEAKSKLWADEVVDVQVEAGKYSAKHWAQKAADVVTSGVINDTTPSLTQTYSSTKINTNLAAHTGDTSNPHSVTKAQVGLGNVPNVDATLNTPSGNISSTTIQGAINELDSEKAIDSAVVHKTGNETINGVKTFTSSVERIKGSNIASASTITIGTAGLGDTIHITGTTTITSLGNATAGVMRTLIFDGILTLIHNATSLILPDGINITTAVGDSAEFVCDTTNNWRCLRYTRASISVTEMDYLNGLNAPIQKIVQVAAVASTSGVAIDFTGIPSWAKRITVLFDQVGTSGTSNILVRIGAGSVVSSGYLATGASAPNAGYSTMSNVTDGFPIALNVAASNSIIGKLTLELTGSNKWLATATSLVVNGTFTQSIGKGVLSLAGALTNLRITTSTGTDTFDSGLINIMYEG